MLWSLLAQRRAKRGGDGAYAAANLNRCEYLEPARFPRARTELARLALLLEDVDGAAGLWRALMVRDPGRIAEYADELNTTYALETPAGLHSDLPAPGRIERAITEAIEANSGARGAVSPAAMTVLGICRDRLNRSDEARRDLARAAALDSTDWRTRLALAVLSLRELDTPAAEPHLAWTGRHFGELDEPARGLYCGAVGLLYAARRDTTEARKWLAEAVRFDPLEPVLRDAVRSTGGNP